MNKDTVYKITIITKKNCITFFNTLCFFPVSVCVCVCATIFEISVGARSSYNHIIVCPNKIIVHRLQCDSVFQNKNENIYEFMQFQHTHTHLSARKHSYLLM